MNSCTSDSGTLRATRENAGLLRDIWKTSAASVLFSGDIPWAGGHEAQARPGTQYQVPRAGAVIGFEAQPCAIFRNRPPSENSMSAAKVGTPSQQGTVLCADIDVGLCRLRPISSGRRLTNPRDPASPGGGGLFQCVKCARVPVLRCVKCRACSVLSCCPAS